MSLIEFTTNNIETVNSRGGILGVVVGAVLGFTLKYAVDRIERQARVKRTGKILEYQVSIIKVQLRHLVVQLNERYKSQGLVTNNKGIDLFSESKLSHIRALDKLALIEYFSNKKKDKAEEYVTHIYNHIDVIDSNMGRLVKLIDNNHASRVLTTKSYKNAVSSLESELIALRHKNPDIEKTDGLVKITELLGIHIKSNELNPEYLLTLEKTFHVALEKAPFDRHGAEYYKPIFDFNKKGKEIIREFRDESDQFSFFIAVIAFGIARAYEGLYGEKLEVPIPSKV